MDKVTQVIMFLAAVTDIYMLSKALGVIHKYCQISNRKKLDPPRLSSDEEEKDKSLSHESKSQTAEFGGTGTG